MTLLRAKGISKHYRGPTEDFVALHKTTLSLPSRGLIAVKGKSGSGKSTLLNILTGIERPSSGKIYYRGKERSSRFPLLGHEAAMIFQHYNLIEGESVLRNVALPLSIAGQRKRKAVELIRRFGLQKQMHQDVATLSGGQKQRVAICRALVSNPEIIFADEPTGALDEENSTEVMEALKSISSKRLVLFVSHNEELISSYAERVIHIADGRVSPDAIPQTKEKLPRPTKRKRGGFRWVFTFLKRNLKRNKWKDCMCFLSGVLGFSSALLSFGFLAGNMEAMEEEQGKSLLFLSASISRRTTVEIPGSSLTLVKKTRPSKEEAMAAFDAFDDYDLLNDYSYFLPSSAPFRCEEKDYEPTAMAPVYDLTLSEYGKELLVWGEAPPDNDFDHCVVNQEFIDKYGADLRGKELLVRARSVVTYQGKQSEVFLDASWTLSCVVREFGFLNTPRIYYSFPGLEAVLEQLEVTGAEGESVSIRDLVDEAKDDSSYGNYSWNVFFHDPNQTRLLFRALDEGKGPEEMEITSTSYALRQSFSSLSEAFVSSLTLFVGIAGAGLCLILGMASYSSFISGRKENAILTVLGARSGGILSIYVTEAMVLTVGSATLALLLSPLLQWGLNALLQKEFDVARLIRIPYQEYAGVTFLVILATLGFALVLGFLSSILPLAVSRHMPIVEDLRDE